MSNQPYTVGPNGNFIVWPKMHDCFRAPCGSRIIVLSIYNGGVVFDNRTAAKAIELHKYTYIGGIHDNKTTHVAT